MPALQSLTQVVATIPGLSIDDCKLAAAFLETHESQREPLEAIQQREKEWSWRTYGVVKRIQVLIQTRVLRTAADFSFLAPDSDKEYYSRTRKVRLMLLRVASRAYTLERGQPPARSEDLVPGYLRRVPIDPKTGKALALPTQ